MVRSGFAFIGRQYSPDFARPRRGNFSRPPERDFLALPPDVASIARHSCLVEGERIYAEASAVRAGNHLVCRPERRVKR